MNPPLCSTTSRSTTASSACTTCSIQMIETPLARTRLMRSTSADAFVLGEPAGDLVEQQEPRAGRKRARQLEPLAVEQREPAGGAVGFVGKAALRQDVHAARVDVALALAAAEGRGDDEVLEHGHAAERLRDLERARDADRCSAAAAAAA